MSNHRPGEVSELLNKKHGTDRVEPRHVSALYLLGFLPEPERRPGAHRRIPTEDIEAIELALQLRNVLPKSEAVA